MKQQIKEDVADKQSNEPWATNTVVNKISLVIHHL